MINLRKTLTEAHSILEQQGIAHALIGGLKIQAYKNDSSRELQDKADIQKLLKLPNIDFTLIKKYAELFQEWNEIEKLRGLK